MKDLSVEEIKKQIEEAKEKKIQLEKDLYFLNEQLKKVCLHPEQYVTETRYRKAQGEFHFYPEDEYYYKRICKACLEVEEHVTKDNELPNFKKIRF